MPSPRESRVLQAWIWVACVSERLSDRQPWEEFHKGTGGIPGGQLYYPGPQMMQAEASRIPLPFTLVAEPRLPKGWSSVVFQTPELVPGRSIIVAEPGMGEVPRSPLCPRISRLPCDL